MYRFVFITNRRVSSCSIILLAHQLLAWSSRLDSGKFHSTLSGSSTLVFFCHSHRFLQRLSSVSTTHHFPLTIMTPWEHFQRLLILLVRFIVPCPHLTHTVPCLANHRCNKTHWRVVHKFVAVRRTSVFFCEISFFFNNCGVVVRQIAVVTSCP